MVRRTSKSGTKNGPGQSTTRSDPNDRNRHSVDTLDHVSCQDKRPSKTKTSKKTISAAGVFKLSKERHRSRGKRRGISPKVLIIDELKDELSEVGDILSQNAESSFDGALAAHLGNLMGIKLEDEKFLETVSRAASMLSVPLTAGLVEVDIIKSNQRISQTMKISDSIIKFKDILRAEQENLNRLWSEWDEVQNQYLELGIQVFGPQSFGDEQVSLEDGLKKEVELIEMQSLVKIAELENEIDEIGIQALENQKKSEKEIDVIMKKEKAKLLATLLDDI